MYGDLHLHTTASDGLLAPEEVVERAHKLGMKFLSITDHDTVQGLVPAQNRAKVLGLELIPGVEISTEMDEIEIHILGYFFDFQDSDLLKVLNKLDSSRSQRAQYMVEKLNKLGFELSIDKVRSISGNGVVGRLHIARAMMDLGYIRNIQEAFQKYIGYKKIAYVERYKLSIQDTIEIILKTGGLPVLAHPILIKRDDLIPKLVKVGLQGIEVYHTDHNFYYVNHYLQIAKTYNLIITGGSDCHGPLYKNKTLMGKINIPYSFVEAMRERQKKFFKLSF